MRLGCRLNINLKGVLVYQGGLEIYDSSKLRAIINSAAYLHPGQSRQGQLLGAKRGIIGLTRRCQKNGSRRITVNVNCPGFYRTDMTAKIPAKLKEESQENPADISAAPMMWRRRVAFYASDEARYITDRYWCVDAVWSQPEGGRSAEKCAIEITMYNVNSVVKHEGRPS